MKIRDLSKIDLKEIENEWAEKLGERAPNKNEEKEVKTLNPKPIRQTTTK